MSESEDARDLLARYRGLLWVLDARGCFRLCAGRGIAGLDARPDGWRDRAAEEVLTDWPRILEGLQASLDGRQASSLLELGDAIFELHFHPLSNDFGEVVGASVLGVPVEDLASGGERGWQARLLDRTFESVLDAVLIIDARSRTIAACNPAAERMFGWSGEEMLGESTRLLHVNETTFERFGRASDQTLDRDGVYRTETRMRRKNGDIFPSRHTVSLIRDDAGRRIAAISVVRDLTAERSSEREIRRSAQRFEAMFAAAPVATVLSRDGVVIDVNPAALQMFGLKSREQAVGSPLRRFVADDDHERVLATIRRREAGEAVPTEYEMNAVREDGTTFDALVRGTKIDLADGPVSVAFLIDISERKSAERAVRESERYFRALTENSAHTIGVLEADGRIRFMTPNVSEALGYEAGELPGRNIFDLIHPDDRKAVRSAWEELIRDAGARISVEARVRHADGGWRNVRSTGRNLIDDPVVGGVVINNLDVTEQRRLQEQLFQAQKMEAIGGLAGGVAHDFNNLLTPMIGYTELALEQLAEDDPLREDIAQVHDAAQRAAALTRKLLAVGRRQVLQPRRLDLDDHVREIERLLRRTLGEDVELVVRLDPREGDVELDPSQLDQILLNLAVNAREAMPDGGTLTLTTGWESLTETLERNGTSVPPGEYVRLTVADTGHGMSDEVRARIFEPFFSTRGASGTGLGLATVYGIVRQSSGFVFVDSQPGEGATFDLWFPKARPATTKRDERQTGRPVRQENADGVPILVVEDSDAVRRFLVRALESAGHEVRAAEDWGPALARLEECAGDVRLAIVDVGLPGGSGLDLASEIHSRWPDVEVLFLSGYPDRRLREHGLPTAARFLAKPVTADRLTSTVEEILDGESSAT